MKPLPLLPVVGVLVLLLTSCGARTPSESAVDPAPVAAEQSTTTTSSAPQPTTKETAQPTTTTRQEPTTEATTSPNRSGTTSPTTTTSRRLAEPVEWVVGFHRWPGLEPGDTWLGETVMEAHEGLRAIVVRSDDPTFKRRAERRANVRYVERNKQRKPAEHDGDTASREPN
ncbi:hypothetical protein [Haloechinothrix salitolerans]|uniref:Uncharacterized protein n=1 Tax=Haloechinothrix salitolerans TaxID=926830 RepID=A0ABW2BWQ2_9PSEU